MTLIDFKCGKICHPSQLVLLSRSLWKGFIWTQFRGKWGEANTHYKSFQFICYVYINSIYYMFGILRVIWRKDSNQMSGVSQFSDRVNGWQVTLLPACTTKHKVKSGVLHQWKESFMVLCWLMHSSRAWTLASMTWEDWLWGHYQNSLTSQHLQPDLCAPWNIQCRMMHCPSNGVHICSFSWKAIGSSSWCIICPV